MLTFPTLITGTITGLRISSVDGTAFLDNCAALIPYADGNHRIEIYDSSSRMLKGVLKAVGTSETLGALLFVNNADFATDEPAGTSWTRGAGWTISGGVAVASSVTGTSLYQGTTTSGVLYKIVVDLKSRTGGTVAFRVSGNSYGATSTVADGITRYITATSAASLGFTGTSFSGTIDNPFAYPVTAPSSSGATIVSSKGGAIYNFASKDDSFTYNAASYRYAIYDTLKVSRPTRYMGVSTHNI